MWKIGVEIIDEEAERKLTSKPKMKTWKKVLLIVGGTIASLVVIVIIVYVSMVNSGRKKLYANATSEKPSFRISEKETDESGETIKELDIYIDDDGNAVIFEGENEKEVIGENIADSSNENESDTEYIGNIENNGETSELKHHTVSFEGVSENSKYDIIFDGVKYAYNKDMITLLILGIDKKGTVQPSENSISGGQSDSLFLLALNPHKKVMNIIAIPRDSIGKVDIYQPDGTFSVTGYAQICLQHAYGDGMELSNERTMKSVSRMLYDLPIHSVTSINMGAIPDLNDAVGGVTLQSLYDITSDGYTFKTGETITLNGMGAYVYTHYRDTTRHNTASERLARQKQYLTIFANQAIEATKNDLGTVIDVYNVISDYVVTDLSIDEMTYLASEAISYSMGEMYSLQGNLNTSMRYERFYLDQDKLYELLISLFYEKIE